MIAAIGSGAMRPSVANRGKGRGEEGCKTISHNLVAVAFSSAADLGTRAQSYSIERQVAGVRVFWLPSSTSFVLDQKPAATGAWSQVAFPYSTNATDISISVPAPAGNKFYRLRKL